MFLQIKCPINQTVSAKQAPLFNPLEYFKLERLVSVIANKVEISGSESEKKTLNIGTVIVF